MSKIVSLYLFGVKELSGLRISLLSDSFALLWKNSINLNSLQNFRMSERNSVMFSLGTGVNFKPYLHNTH